MKLSKKTIIPHALLISLIFLVLGFYLSEPLKNYFILAFLISLCLSILIGFSVSRAITKRINEVAELSREISKGNFQKKLLITGDDEIGDLGRNLNAMAEELRVKIENLTSEKRTLEVILSSMYDGLLMIDMLGNITLSNAAVNRILNISENIVGRPFFEVIRDPAIHDLEMEVRKTGKSASREIEIFYPSNRYLYVTATPLYPGEAEAGFLLVFHDITKLKHLETVRKDFVANVSHEIKTPITAIKGFAETLLDGALEDKEHVRKHLEIIKNHSERLNNLVEDLLTLSSLDKGEVYLRTEAVDVKKLIDSIFLTLKAKASSQDIALINEIPDDFPHVRADRNRLIQIFLNLVDNAIKFTEYGTVTARGVVDDNQIKILIEDTGIGIQAKDIPRLGERFYRVDRARSRMFGGTGLGLAIVKHLVRAHNWEMKIESEVGRGTKVILFVPLLRTS
ncbi:MAG: HAMP domain-containing protein [Nitrospirae bacterium]|nr:HAMP domain-containing protein [Nitrospirota bacterium]